ncbi:hypothetical protein [Nocardia wallacei]|uniref:hypothetical protein n=1 Tax=Nocardia wallacei TaxID=480035 RepID=UPI00245911ED|nr:hypothetical protein [Nocardia wallacei]
MLAVLGLALVLYLLIRLAAAPSAPPPPDVAPRPDTDDYAPPEPDLEGSDSIFGGPPWLVYGGLQWLVFGAIVVWWRARRRGALVGEPRPVEVAADELLAGQAALYRKSRDRDHVAAALRGATLRRIRPAVGLTAEAPAQRVVETIARRTSLPVDQVGAVLYGPVTDDATLRLVAAHLERIESEIG